ncbi:MAG: RNA polymerase sigma factor, partial [Planctomycetota bacterium]|nr:RNA polymerase sigma factor [Planctomycetota bacterium]
PAAFATWAFRIIRNKSADYWRCDGYRQQLIAKSASQQRCDGQTNVSNRCDCLAEAIRRMPTERQELLALRYGENLSVIEIARILGVPPGTIKSRLYHAREELKRLIEGEEK